MIKMTRRSAALATLAGLAAMTVAGLAGTASAAPATAPPVAAVTTPISAMPSIQRLGGSTQPIHLAEDKQRITDVLMVSCQPSPTRPAWRIPITTTNENGIAAATFDVPEPDSATIGWPEALLVYAAAPAPVARSECWDGSRLTLGPLSLLAWSNQDPQETAMIPPPPASAPAPVLPGQATTTHPAKPVSGVSPHPVTSSTTAPSGTTAPALAAIRTPIADAPADATSTGPLDLSLDESGARVTDAIVMSCQPTPDRSAWRVPIQHTTAYGVPAARLLVPDLDTGQVGWPISLAVWVQGKSTPAAVTACSASLRGAPIAAWLPPGLSVAPVAATAIPAVTTGTLPVLPGAATSTRPATAIAAATPTGPVVTPPPATVPAGAFMLPTVHGPDRWLPVAIIAMLIASTVSLTRDAAAAWRARHGHNGTRHHDERHLLVTISAPVALVAASAVAVRGTLPEAVLASALAGYVLASRAAMRRGVPLTPTTLGRFAITGWHRAVPAALAGVAVVAVWHHWDPFTQESLFAGVVAGMAALSAGRVEAVRDGVRRRSIAAATVSAMTGVPEAGLLDGSVRWEPRADGGFAMGPLPAAALRSIADREALADRVAAIDPTLELAVATRDEIVVAAADIETLQARETAATTGGLMTGFSDAPQAEPAPAVPLAMPGAVDVVKRPADDFGFED